MGIPLRPFKHTPKSPVSVLDSLPPVFTTHEDLHKGHRREAHQHHLQPHGNKVGPNENSNSASNRQHHAPKSATVAAAIRKYDSPPEIANRSATTISHSPTSAPKHLHTNGTSSTALWIASVNATVASSKRHPPLTPSRSDKSLLNSKGSNHTSDSYYEEEIIEDGSEGDFFEFESGDEPLATEGGDGADDTSDGGGDELNLFPDRNPTIRFDEYDEMQTVLHINDYTRHEIHRAWYKREDYDKMVQLARKTAEKAEQRKKELEEYQKQHHEEEKGNVANGLNRVDPDRGNNRRDSHTHIPDASQRSRHTNCSGDTRSQRHSRSGSHGSRLSAETDDDYENVDFDDADASRRSRTDSSKASAGVRRGATAPNTKDRITAANGKEKMKKPIEYRGLEAWTSSGAAKAKILKESAIELVWNEQSRQWDTGLFNPEAIRDVYLAVSQTAQQAARDRGTSDALIVERLRQLEEAEAEKKRHRKILGKSKALFTKSVRMTGKGVKNTGRLMQKTTKATTKVAKEATKRSVKAGVATATLDPRMMKEALKLSLKKRECKHEVIRKPSQSHIQEYKEGKWLLSILWLV